MKAVLHNEWQSIIGDEFEKPYYQQLRQTLIQEYRNHQVFPPMDDIYRAFHLTDYSAVKVVIIGQDPYHDDHQANGLCFSVHEGVKIPPSLRNIYKEMSADIGCKVPSHGNLEAWAKQGVLMLNAVLTVRAHQAASHQKLGWQQFTDHVIEALNDRIDPVIFVLWGNFARSKKKMITNDRHIIIESAHPSPLSANRGFFGSRPFSKINSALEAMDKEVIEWCIE